jgi:hypothetical protein
MDSTDATDKKRRKHIYDEEKSERSNLPSSSVLSVPSVVKSSLLGGFAKKLVAARVGCE